MARTGFEPHTHGFAFANAWRFDDHEKATVRKVFKDAIMAPGTFLRLLPGDAVTTSSVRPKLVDWVENALVEPYGMCGGMAFAALDYYHAQLDAPRGVDARTLPTRDTLEGDILRTYIWRRLIESLAANVGTFLIWMAFLHHVPEDGLLKGGPGWLRRQTERQWNKLKKRIDDDKPSPLGLVGTTRDPTMNHQVLAYGYDDHEDGTGTVYLYDMNCPGAEQTLNLDFAGEKLVEDSCHSDTRGDIQGFFLENYWRNIAPPVVKWP